jgi:transcriptional regulator with XRE-family HTH domain
MMSVGETLLVARRRAGLSQKDLADAIGVSGTFVSYIEYGRAPFPPERLDRLPEGVREAVAEAMIAEAEAKIERLRRAVSRGT